MKKLLFIAALCIGAIVCHAQQKLKNTLAKDANGNSISYSISAPSAGGCGLGLIIDDNTKWISSNNSVANQPLTNAVFLRGTKKIKLEASVLKDSIKNYRYSVIGNDNTWLTTNAALKPGGNTFNRYYISIPLGEYNVENKKLIVQVYNINEPTLISTVIIYNKPIAPAPHLATNLSITTNGERAVAMQRLDNGFSLKIHGKETVNGIIVVNKPSDINFIYHVYLKNKQTKIIWSISNNWLYSFYTGEKGRPYPYLTIDASYFDDPGDYQIIIKPETSTGFATKPLPGKAVTINFTVLPSGKMYEEKFVITIASLIVAVSAGIAGLVIIYLKRKNRKKLLKEQQQKDMAQVQLSAVRSQLNPHFMFNALSGIQNLMNKNETDQANRYLAKFARITRTILNNNELISLKDEQSLLDDYLQMEQLRFGFTYKIDVDKNLNAENVEIPAMLLQPFVENAVKHGIADMGKNGYIYLNMAGKNKNVVLTVTDNGKGFDAGEQNKGMGIALIKKRIALLNTVYGSSPVLLDIKPAPANTMVIITLTNWL